MSSQFRSYGVAASLALILSAVAVTVVSSPWASPLMRRLSRLAESFVSPGELLWWATFGGAFAGYPSGVSGHFIWVVGSALFWFLASTPLIAVAPHLRGWLRNAR